MLNIFFIVARESLEAILIIGIIATFIKKENIGSRGTRYMVSGILGGVLLSGLLALMLFNLDEWLDGQGIIYFEAGLFLISAFFMTQMVYWMRKMGNKMKGALEDDLRQSLGSAGLWGILAVTALGIGREGAEICTYIYSLSMSGQYSFLQMFTVCGLGLVFGASFYRLLLGGMTRLNIRTFFAVTSVFLFLTAGSLLMDAVSRLTDLDVLPSLVPMLWNTNGVLPASSFLGQTLALLVGYRPAPSLMMVLVYGGYWLFIFATYYYRPAIKITRINGETA